MVGREASGTEVVVCEPRAVAHHEQDQSKSHTADHYHGRGRGEGQPRQGGRIEPGTERGRQPPVLADFSPDGSGLDARYQLEG